MKTKIILTALFLTTLASISNAQLTGKKFITGGASLNFNNTKQPEQPDNNGYGYGISFSLSKFKTETRVSGWSFSSALDGGKTSYTNFENGEIKVREIDGIKRFGLGLGHFWHFYKHFNEKIGIYGGPDISVSFNNQRNNSVASDGRYFFEQLDNSIALSAGLSSGIYYRLSEKWWVDASLAFASPVNVSYGFTTSKNVTEDDTYKSRQFNYRFSPSFNFPSVGIGVRYFYNR